MVVEAIVDHFEKLGWNHWAILNIVGIYSVTADDVDHLYKTIGLYQYRIALRTNCLTIGMRTQRDTTSEFVFERTIQYSDPQLFELIESYCNDSWLGT